MKKINFLILAALIAAPFFFSSCKKKKDDPTPVNGGNQPNCTTLLVQEDVVYTGGSARSPMRKAYKYNANKMLVKIEYSFDPGYAVNYWDTIVYNGSGEIATVESYNTAVATAAVTNTYTYTAGKITKINEVIPAPSSPSYDRDRVFTYTSGILSAQTVTYNSGSDPNAGPENISSIVFTNGNVTSADLGTFGGLATVTEETTAANPYYGLNNNSDILLLFNKNNATSVYSNADPTHPFFTITYTYANGKVSTMAKTDPTTGQTATTTFTYDCR
jgi:hypothetical protein